MKHITIILVLLFSYHINASETDKAFNVVGKITDKWEGAKVYLENAQTSNFEIIDSSIVVDNTFKLEAIGKMNLFSSIRIQKEELGWRRFFINLENNTLEVEVDDNISNISFSGTESAAWFNEFNEYQIGLREEIIRLYHKIDSLNKIKNQSPESNVELDKLQSEMAEINVRLTSYLKDSYLKNQEEYLLFYCLIYSKNFYDNKDIEFLTLMYDTGIEIFDKSALNKLSSYTNESAKIGEIAPNFTLPNLSGELISLDMLRGKKVFIDFWASWCAPCRKQVPELLDIYQKLNDEEVVFISISIDKKISNWEKAIRQDQSESFLHLVDKDFFVKDKYLVEQLPTNFIIDENGVIVKRDIELSKLLEVMSE